MKGNDFIKNLREGLEFNNYEISDFKYWRISELFSNRNETKFIYLHWPESMWRGKNIVKCLIKILQFFISVKSGKILGYQYIWSAHNVKPHNQVYFPRLERIARKFILRNFQLIIGHSKNCKQDLEKEYNLKLKNYTLAYHGIYQKKQINTIPETLKNIDFSKKTFLVFYDDNDYKGSKDFVQFFNKTFSNDNECQLIIGKAKEKYNAKNIFEIPGFITEEEITYLFYKSNYLVLPYKDITTSGMFFLAVTYDLPILAPAISFFKKHGVLESTVFLYDPENYEQSLTERITKLSTQKSPEHYKLLQKKYSWETTNNIIGKAIGNLIN